MARIHHAARTHVTLFNILQRLLSFVERIPPTTMRYMGTFLTFSGTIAYCPINFQQHVPQEFQWANKVAEELLHIGERKAMFFCSGMTRLQLDYRIHQVTLLSWLRHNRQQYQLRTIYTSRTLKFKHLIPWSSADVAHIGFVTVYAEEELDYRSPDFDSSCKKKFGVKL